jgi:hypothetical protein
VTTTKAPATTNGARSLEAWATEAEAAAGIARALAQTAFLPDSLKIYRDQQRTKLDLDATVAQAAAALLTGQELGLSPMAALRSIDVIPPGSGSPALRAAALRALVQHHGHDIWVTESTDTRAVVRGLRAGTDIVQESVWTIDRAKRMRLRGFNSPDGAWQRMPKNQLVARATAECARLIAADVLLGLPYVVEEILDEPDADGDGSSAESGAPMNARPGASARRRRRPAAALSPVSATPADQSGGGALPESPPITGSQRARLWAGLKRIGLTDKDQALETISRWVGRHVTSSNDLTSAEASLALDAIQGEEDTRAAREQTAVSGSESESERLAGPGEGDDPGSGDA